MKLIVMPTNIEEIKKTVDYCDGYLIGINGLSVNMNLSVDEDELSHIKSLIGKKELFISLNKNIHNEDLYVLTETMKLLNDYDITGVFYYDVAIINIYNKNKFNYKLIWASEHAATNYNTINYWQSFGVKGCCISSDITIKEVYDIRKNTKCELFVPIFGYQPMFNSRRHIVKNYLDYFSLDDNSQINYIEKEEKRYPIVDNEQGTSVFTNYILNGLCEYNSLKDNSINYILFNSFNIDDEKIIATLKTIKEINKNNLQDKYEKINSMFDNCSSGFLYQETISRVKKNEK